MELKPHKLFSKRSFLLILGGSLVLTMFFVIKIDIANAITPPTDAQCTRIVDDKYLCKGDVPTDDLIARLPDLRSQTFGECINECIDSGGISMQFTEDGKTNLYCYGATEEGTCNLFSGGIISSRQDVNVKTGEVQESCSAVNFACHIRNVLVAMGNLGQNLILAVLGIIADLLGVIFFFIAKVFAWTIGALTSITVSPNHIDTVPIVKTGWEISRDIANMFFIIILSFIGLATILGIESYKAKKLLPTLLLVALLMNFSGVLVGFIVDIGNLFTNFFLNKAVGLEWNLTFPGDPLSSTAGVSETLGGHLARIIFYIVASIIYVAISFIFFIRIFFLWTLAILAPLAFAAFILPATKKYWNQWWEQLIQWSILGIPMAFFIYLSRLALEPTVQTSLKNIGENTGPNPLVNFMGPFVALFLLFLGISISTSMAPSAAQGIIGGFKKYSKAAGKGLGGMAGTAAWRKMGSPLEKFGENVRKRGQGQEIEAGEATRMERLVGATLGKVIPGGLANNRITRWGARTIGRGIESGSRRISTELEAIDAGKISARREAAKKDGNSKNSINNVMTSLGLGQMDDALGYMMGIGDNGDSDDVLAAIDNGKMNWNDVSKIYKTAVQRGTPYRRHIEKMFLGEVLDEENNRLGVSDKNREQILEKITLQDWANDLIPPDYLDSEKYENADEVLDKVMSSGGASFMPQIMRRSEKGLRRRIWAHAKSKDDQWFIDNGAEDILQWSKSSAAQGLGLSALGSMNPAEIRERVEIRDSDISDENIESKVSELKKAILDEGAEKFKADFLGHTDTNHKAEITRLSSELGKYEEMARIRTEKKQKEAAISEEQPIAVQITRLKKESDGLESRTKMKHLPGKQAKDRRKAIDLEIKGLEEQQSFLPNEVRQKEQEVLGIEQVIIELEDEVSEVEKDISIEDKVLVDITKGADAKEQSRKRIEMLKRGITELKKRKSEQSREKGKVMLEWKSIKSENARPEQDVAHELSALRKDGRAYTNELARAVTAKESRSKIIKAKSTLETARNKIAISEQSLVGILHTQDLERELKRAQGARVQEIQNEIKNIKEIIGDYGKAGSTQGIQEKSNPTTEEERKIATFIANISKIQKTASMKNRIKNLEKGRGDRNPPSVDTPARPTPPRRSAPGGDGAISSRVDQPSGRIQRPNWLESSLNTMKRGGVPNQITNRLRQYLKNQGMDDEKIRRMTPQQAWEKADELSRGE